MRIQEALAAVDALLEDDRVDPAHIYVWGQGSLAVPALYAAVVDGRVAGVLLEGAPDRHRKQGAAETGLLHIRVHADLAHVGGLLYPRPCTLIRRKEGRWEWTAALYEALGRPSEFRRVSPEGGTFTETIARLTKR